MFAGSKSRTDFFEVMRTIMWGKVIKHPLVKPNDDDVLILERQNMNFVPKQILDDVRKQAVNFPLMATVDYGLDSLCRICHGNLVSIFFSI